ncbi:MAG: RidA family protein [Clostridiales Family XIII bacterium]|jgi:2-iminobutanoate/2-iminopropanoate deaminase|nr:RidA family protein [Clostridiales Family XIII bacterium]
MDREIIKTDKAPAAIGPYAQANKAGGLIFTSGQIPLDPQSGELVGADAATQAEQVLRNLEAVLEAAGSGPDRVLKTTVFLADIADFAAVNEVYARHFAGAALPSRSAVQVAALPKGALVEIEVIAYE